MQNSVLIDFIQAGTMIDKNKNTNPLCKVMAEGD